MKGWLLTAAAIVVPGGVVIGLAVWLRRRWLAHRRRWAEGNYRAQIASLAPVKPMTLPAVRDLQSTVRYGPFKRREQQWTQSK